MSIPPPSASRPLRLLSAILCSSTFLFLGGCGLIGAGVATAVSLAPLKLMFACLPEGTEIDIPGGGKQAIETLRSGDLVMGYDGDPVRILQIHGYLEDPEKSVFHSITFSNGSVVDLCSMHRIEGIRAKDLREGTMMPSGLSVVSSRTYRGVNRSYDILTEDSGYRIGGIPVNSMIEEMYAAGRTGRTRG